MIGSYVKKGIKKFFSQLLPNQKFDDMEFDSWNGIVYDLNVPLDTRFLTDLSLDFGLPLEVVKGVVGKLNIKIPWPNIFGDKLDINIENLCVVVYCKLERLEDYLKYIDKKKDLKNLSVNDKEIESLIENICEKMGQVKPTNKSGFLTKYMNKIKENIWIIVKNVSIKIVFGELDDSKISLNIGFNSLTFKTYEDKSGNFLQKIQVTSLEGFFLRCDYYDNLHWMSMLKNAKNNQEFNATSWFDEDTVKN